MILEFLFQSVHQSLEVTRSKQCYLSRIEISLLPVKLYEESDVKEVDIGRRQGIAHGSEWISLSWHLLLIWHTGGLLQRCVLGHLARHLHYYLVGVLGDGALFVREVEPDGLPTMTVLKAEEEGAFHGELLLDAIEGDLGERCLHDECVRHRQFVLVLRHEVEY